MHYVLDPCWLLFCWWALSWGQQPMPGGHWSYLSDISAKKDHFLQNSQRRFPWWEFLEKQVWLMGFLVNRWVSYNYCSFPCGKFASVSSISWTYFLFLGVVGDHSGPKWSGGEWMEKWGCWPSSQTASRTTAAPEDGVISRGGCVLNPGPTLGAECRTEAPSTQVQNFNSP